ncbi:hypothetical protein [Nonomuraea sp. NPDC050310]|uniref:hypothetical protein n=1 Tax=unclassified Nonomuraea TaxID=2593643 RepID=UPI0033D4C817
MPKYAAAVAPVIDAAHIDGHAASRPLSAEAVRASGLTPGLLVDQRFTLPLRPLTRAGLAAVYRYGTAAEREPVLRAHLDEGALEEEPAGTFRVTAKGLAFIELVYRANAEATATLWAGHDVATLAGLAGRVLEAALDDAGPALRVMAPPYEPDPSPGLLLFNRLAALRYHRADAHAAAWQAAGLTAAQVTALPPGETRERIEQETNRRAAVPYRVLTETERGAFLDGLLALVRPAK